MQASRPFWRKRVLVFAALIFGLGLAPALCQNAFNEREVKSLPSAIDRADVYAMDFKFKDPRIIKVNVPGRGTRFYWYMWFQVINRTGRPHKISPLFELVTHDYPAVYIDEPYPPVLEEIRRQEDPTGYQDIKSTSSFARAPIPVSKSADEAFPRAVTGAAVWESSPADPKKRDPKVKDLSDTTRFTIFVRGLSNGMVEVDPPAPGLPPIIQYKTLKLDFRRRGDRYSTDSRDIEFVAPAQWIYRSAGRTIPTLKVPEPEKKDNAEK
jgi:hypothetical protein